MHLKDIYKLELTEVSSKSLTSKSLEELIEELKSDNSAPKRKRLDKTTKAVLEMLYKIFSNPAIYPYVNISTLSTNLNIDLSNLHKILGDLEDQKLALRAVDKRSAIITLD